MQIAFKGKHEFKISNPNTREAVTKAIQQNLEKDKDQIGLKDCNINTEEGTGSFIVNDAFDKDIIDYLTFNVAKNCGFTIYTKYDTEN